MGMIYSRGCEYGIRAMAYLANQATGHYYTAKEIARADGIPAHFLAKTLQKLAQQGLLRSFKGPTGGFCLGRPARQITLYDIVVTIDGLTDFTRCAVGFADCTDKTPCPMHDQWSKVREDIKQFMLNQTVADLARTVAEKKGLLLAQKIRRQAKPKTKPPSQPQGEVQ